MPMTKKEQSLLKDLQNEEKLCAEKYAKAAEAACDPALKTMLGQIAKAEQNHYDTVTDMLAGKVPAPAATQPKAAKQQAAPRSTATRAGKKQDAYLLADLLATEKYVAAVYNMRREEPPGAQRHSAAGAAPRQANRGLYAGQRHVPLKLKKGSADCGGAFFARTLGLCKRRNI